MTDTMEELGALVDDAVKAGRMQFAKEVMDAIRHSDGNMGSAVFHIVALVSAEAGVKLGALGGAAQ